MKMVASSSFRWRLRVLPASFLSATLAACTVVGSSAPIPDASVDTAQALIGAGGGTLSTPDGFATLTVPRGAVDHDVMFTVGPTAPPLPGAVGRAFEIGPAGTQFAAPATVSLRYTAGDLGDASSADLIVATVVAGQWQPLAPASPGGAAMAVSGATGHLSPFVLVHAAALIVVDAGSCVADNSTVGSCASPARPLCSAAPGTVAFSCSNHSGGGYSANCCPPSEAGAPIDAGFPADAPANADAALDASFDAGDASTACTVDEMTAGTCAAPDQPLCSDLAGTLASSCVDNPVGPGFTALCCPAGDAGDGG
jgi:hypothetical protein